MTKEPEPTASNGERHHDASQPRRPYVAPELIEYGTVAKLTQTGGMTSTDFFLSLRRMGM
jgi:hypothetical protein